MFGNFIYFIIVLLIYSTYQPSEDTNFTALETLFLFILLTIIFAVITWLQFQRIEKQVSKESFAKVDHKFHAALTRQSVMAIVLFSLDIYGLNLVSFVSSIPFLSIIPTLQALLFLGLFVFYLAIVWAFAYSPYNALYTTGLPRESYILSNISFSVPILLPWLLLSCPGCCFPELPTSSTSCRLSCRNKCWQPPKARCSIFLFSLLQLP
ncbi:MAG: hypothetical protein JRJ46_07555 [Deltaproteobacteria bacterium]|nr:hypothetical protein [Deltaproteobacteria bacterium]